MRRGGVVAVVGTMAAGGRVVRVGIGIGVAVMVIGRGVGSFGPLSDRFVAGIRLICPPFSAVVFSLPAELLDIITKITIARTSRSGIINQKRRLVLRLVFFIRL
jgi:hypothetical protein